MPDTNVAYPFGIANVDLKTAERPTPENQPPAWPPNSELKVVGKPATRLDGRLKVTGAAKYSADIRLPGMLYAYMLTSPVAAADIKSIDTSAAEKAPGVAGVFVLRDKTVRYGGEPIAAVAAGTPAQAAAAVRLIKLDLEEKPFVVDVEKARQADAPVVTKSAETGGGAGGGGAARGSELKGNVRSVAPNQEAIDNVEKGLKEADVVVEAFYKTQVQTHSPLETHGVVADFKPDLLTVYASTQGTASVRDEMAAKFDLKKSQVRVITEFMGGGFGAKFGAGDFGVMAAELSKKTGKPVWLMLDRHQQHLSVGNRPSSNQKIRIGAKKDGTLTAIENINYGIVGTSNGAGATGPARGLYPCPAIYTNDSDVLINAGPATAMRSPGAPQGVYGFEQAMDELAHKLSMDPLALRDKLDQSESRRVERKRGAEIVNWASRYRATNSDPGPIKKGIGLANSIWGRHMNKNSHCEVRITHDGSVEFMSSVQDIGGGARTMLAMVVAEELGLKPTDITMKIGDTSYPIGPNSGGSVTTNSISPAARTAAWAAKQQLLAEVAPALGAASPADFVMEDGKISLKSDASKSLSFRAACGKMKGEQISAKGDRLDDFKVDNRRSNELGGVQFAEITVDTETGVIKVDRVVAIHDCGRPINPLGVVSQINGGILQGISYALYENRILDQQRGLMVNPNLEQYKIVGAMETPTIEVELIEQYWGKSNTDAGGIGEPANIATAAAIGNAFFNATGVRIREIPMTPAVVLRELGKIPGLAPGLAQTKAG